MIAETRRLNFLQAARLAADAFAFQFPDCKEDIERVRNSIAEEENLRRAAIEQSIAARAERTERQRAASDRRDEDPRAQGGHIFWVPVSTII